MNMTVNGPTQTKVNAKSDRSRRPQTRANEKIGIRTSGVGPHVCRSTIGTFWSGYDDPLPTLVCSELNKAEPLVEPGAFAAQGSSRSYSTTSLAERYTRKIRQVVRHLPDYYPKARLWEKPLLSYAHMVSHPTLTKGGELDVALIRDAKEREHKIAVTEDVISHLGEVSDGWYDSLCLYNTDFSRTYPWARLVHSTPMPTDSAYPLAIVEAYGKVVQSHIEHRLSHAPIQDFMAHINESKGLGFYAFHPDGSRLTRDDLYLKEVQHLLPKTPIGHVYDDGLNGYAVKNSRRLRIEWQRSERCHQIWKHFIANDYVEDILAFERAFEIGGVMVQTNGERRNQCDTWLNKEDLSKSVVQWRRNAYGKNRAIAYESDELKFVEFRRDDKAFEDAARSKLRFDAKGCRARPVKGQPSTTIGPVLNCLNRGIWHHTESSSVGFPSYRREYLDGLERLRTVAEIKGLDVLWYRSDDENSEQQATSYGERLSHMYHGNWSRIYNNESIAVVASRFGPLVVPFSLMSGDPFTTSKNVVKGALNFLRSCGLMAGTYTETYIERKAHEYWDAIWSDDPERLVEIYEGVYFAPRLGTDDQMVPILFRHEKKHDLLRRFEKVQKLVQTYGTNAELKEDAHGFGLDVIGFNAVPSAANQFGKLEYFEMSKKQRTSPLQAFTFYQRLKLLPPSIVGIVEASYRKQWDGDFSQLPRIEKWFFEEVVHARGYPIPALFNQYSPVDQIAFRSLIDAYDGDETSYYTVDDVGRNLDLVINFILS